MHLVFSLFFQRRDVYGAWEQYLGLEHPDNTPKRSYAVNQVCVTHTTTITSMGLLKLPP